MFRLYPMYPLIFVICMLLCSDFFVRDTSGLRGPPRVSSTTRAIPTRATTARVIPTRATTARPTTARSTTARPTTAWPTTAWPTTTGSTTARATKATVTPPTVTSTKPIPPTKATPTRASRVPRMPKPSSTSPWAEVREEDRKLDRDYWYNFNRETLKRRLALFPPQPGQKTYAKNVLLFVGDGMSMSTITAARILKGQRQGKAGEEEELTFESFPAVGLIRTYNLNAQVGESSACATAMFCGVKTNYETLGLDSGGRLDDCLSSFTARVPSLIDWAQTEGKSTGIVTTSRITHATPAALYAHTPNRYWEDDSKVPLESRPSCKDIARQLVEDMPARNINVLLGGGRKHFLPTVARDPEEEDLEGKRLDGRNLIDDWVREKKKRGMKHEYVWNKGLFDKVDPNNTDYLLGLFGYSHMDFESDRSTGPNGDPSIGDMTKKALEILKKNKKGFFLMVEGARIDHAHHYNNPYRALDETMTMESALMQAMSMVDLTETLVIVTADHSHVMTMGGLLVKRGNPILGSDGKRSDIDGQLYTTILYGNGPGYSLPRWFVTNETNYVNQENRKDEIHSSAVPRNWGTHSGEDVPIYATGPMAMSLISGVMDQSYLAHAIAYAACYDIHASRCQGGTDNYAPYRYTIPCPEPTAIISKPKTTRKSVVLASSVLYDGNSYKTRVPHPQFKPFLLVFLQLWLDIYYP